MASDRLAHPGVRFPPPLLFVGGFVAGWLLERALPPALRYGVRGPGTSAAGWLLILAGLTIVGWALVTFRRHRTAVLPDRPAARLVTTGPYRLSRNPMYAGLTVAYVGLALLSGLLWPVAFLPLVLALLRATVVRREERYLADAFGPAYAAYRARVRRWL